MSAEFSPYVQIGKLAQHLTLHFQKDTTSRRLRIPRRPSTVLQPVRPAKERR